MDDVPVNSGPLGSEPQASGLTYQESSPRTALPDKAVSRGHELWPGTNPSEPYRQMAVIRRFEETMSRLFVSGQIVGPLHLSIGQEAVAVGACDALLPGDLVVSNHRGHGHCIARGASLRRMAAEILGRSTGYCKGRGGSMHIVDARIGLLGTGGVVAGGLALAVGAGWAKMQMGAETVCLVFFGDGAAQEGLCHEAMNIASLWRAPVVFVCENNQYAVTVPLSKQSSVLDVSTRAASYGMPGERVDGMDVSAVHAAVEEASQRARAGLGPSLVECITYRFVGHSRGDPGVGAYRTAEEVQEWEKRDPLLLYRHAANLSDAVCAELDAEAADAVNDAVQFARAQPRALALDAYTDIWSLPSGEHAQ